MDLALFHWLFFPLFAMAIAWLVMVWWLFRRLAMRHPAKYQQMGKPGLFANNTPGGAVRLFKFLFSGEARALADASLARLVDVMRVWLLVYLAGFGALLVMVLRTTAAVS